MRPNETAVAAPSRGTRSSKLGAGAWRKGPSAGDTGYFPEVLCAVGSPAFGSKNRRNLGLEAVGRSEALGGSGRGESGGELDFEDQLSAKIRALEAEAMPITSWQIR